MNEIYDTLEKIVAYLHEHGDNKVISGINGVLPKTLLYNEQTRTTRLDDLVIKLIDVTKTTIYGEINVISEESSERKLEIYCNNELKETARRFLGGRKKVERINFVQSEKIPSQDWEVDDRYLDLFKDIFRRLEEKYKKETDKQNSIH